VAAAPVGLEQSPNGERNFLAFWPPTLLWEPRVRLCGRAHNPALLAGPRAGPPFGGDEAAASGSIRRSRAPINANPPAPPNRAH